MTEETLAGSVQEKAGSRGLLVVSEHHTVDETIGEQLFEMMQRAYAVHATKTTFRYRYEHDEWMGFMANPLIIKWVATLDGELAGLLTGAPVDTVFHMDPAFYAARYPGRRVWVQEDTFVDPTIKDLRVVKSLFQAGLRWAKANEVVISFGTADHMVHRRYIDLIRRFVASELPDAEVVEVDAYRYYEFDTVVGAEPPVTG